VAMQLSGFIEASPDAMICANTQGRIVYWNDAAVRMFGIPAEAAVGASLDLIVPEAMRGAHDAGIRRLASGGAPRIVGRVVEVIAQHADGRKFAIEMSLAMWQERGERVFGAVVRDISERRRNEERLHHLAHFDQLTLLPNRTMFLERVDVALATDRSSTVVLVDLDRFKEVNDQFGHLAGDKVLCESATRLRECVTQPEATVARLGGDEFAIIIPHLADPLIADRIADSIRSTLNQPFEIDDQSVTVGCSIGIALGPAHGNESDELIGSADLALYRAKSEGGDRRQFFMPQLRDTLNARRRLEVELQRAWNEQEFEVFYQPQVRLRDGAVTGAEALLRWRHPERGLLAPVTFISVLEPMKLSEAIGQWVLEVACKQAFEWRRHLPSFRIGVNLFETQLRSDGLVSNVANVLATSTLPPESLELEITENVLLSDDDAWVTRIRAISEVGIRLAFDDYGTGYASLSLLKKFPLTRLKIDRSFVRDLATDADDAAIVSAVVSLGRGFGLGVIAEGVETQQQAQLLMECGCEEAQGYLYGKPIAAKEFGERLTITATAAKKTKSSGASKERSRVAKVVP
jgi:diguanylate cyclase (GGDEF)-like protein/PAS domain S-box-containing protein